MRKISLIVGLVLLSACGQKGPLYLPPNNPDIDATTPAQAVADDEAADNTNNPNSYNSSNNIGK